MIGFAPSLQDVLRYVVGFELRHGRAATPRDVADALFDFSVSRADTALEHLRLNGRVRTSPWGKRGFFAAQTLTVPRAPDGEPLFFVRIGESAL